ncbi:TetR/AcrR family transcriptional regulator [Gordonia sputi]|uniref:TetR/AcrR family transcriptional regulator n=1 Tax=Gordonia sputi TaxID=36823 RepID=UPI003699B5B3
MATGKTRADNRAAMEAEILQLGREHLRTQGAAGLSLRAIARDLGVVSSAVYRYVPSRDDLLTLLLVEGYNDVADTVDAAADADAADNDADRTDGASDSRKRLRRMAVAMRAWALTDPARWALLYGSPVPGYSAPAERTTLPGTRVVGRLIVELAAAHRDGSLRAQQPPISPAVAADMRQILDEFGVDMPAEVVAAATTLWATIMGGISLEVFGQYGADTFTHPDALFTTQVDAVLSLLFDD